MKSIFTKITFFCLSVTWSSCLYAHGTIIFPNVEHGDGYIDVKIYDSKESFSNNDFEFGKFHIINIWASWCLPCKAELPFLMDLKNNSPELTILGFNHKDKRDDAIEFLSTNGNPYSFVGVDSDGMIGFKFGVFGLPETFLTNNQGKIIYKHIGPLTNKVIQKEILPNL